jgi:hypothetical protein
MLRPIILFCIVNGNPGAAPIAVEIDREELISALKDAIREKMPNCLRGADTHELWLWKWSRSTVGEVILGSS